MDLVAGAKRVFVAMEHVTREKRSKIVRKCTLPITGVAVVDHIVTELALVDVMSESLDLRELVRGVTVEEVQSLTDAQLLLPPAGPREMLV